MQKQLQDKIEFDLNLPIVGKKNEIAELINKNQVVIVAGETGSGKTTQLPKICLELGRGLNGRVIGHTQPRRIATKSVAARIAEELQTTIGAEVGYKIRFTDRTSIDSIIKVMTDGILLSELHSDPLLKSYDTIIIDEAHERSLNIDLILGILKKILPKRPDLKLIITSATIDPEKFSNYFDKAPIIEVSGRGYPVEIKYLPHKDLVDNKECDINQHILSAIEQLPKNSNDILVFLPGEKEIKEAKKELEKKLDFRFIEILVLYARLSNTEQQKIFTNNVKRKIILSTNIAETSITIPGIKYVIDSGKVKISKYNYRNQLQSLVISNISQAAAKQRSGRCGRVSSGICIRLYSEEDFNSSSEFTEPEILRSNLATVILKMSAMELGDLYLFPFLDSPDSGLIKDGFRLLIQLGAITEKHELTQFGKKLAKMPVDPRIAAIILRADKFDCVQEILIITSVLSAIDPREQANDQQTKELYKKYREPDSDFLEYLKLWDYIAENQQALSKNKFKKFCEIEKLSWLRIKEWQEIYHELYELACQNNLTINTKRSDYRSIHQVLLYGFMLNIGNIREDGFYLGVKNKKFHIFPGSVLFKKSPKWILAFQIINTTRVYGRTLAKIQPEWIEAAGKGLFKYSYSEPIWQKKSGYVVALEAGYLFGLNIYNNRRVNYERIDLKISHEVFVRSALVHGEYFNPPKQLQENFAVIDQIEELEHKIRSRSLLNEYKIFEFYINKVPVDICNYKSFEKWLKKNKQDNDIIKIIEQDILDVDDLHGNQQLSVKDQLPDCLIYNKTKLKLDYCFDPSSNIDGITIDLDVQKIEGLDLNSEKKQKIFADYLDWLIPALIEEKIVYLLKSLPKHIRVNIIPIPDYAKAINERIDYRYGNLLEQISKELWEIVGFKIDKNNFNLEVLPAYLSFNYKIIDNKNNQELYHGKDLNYIINKYVNKGVDKQKEKTDNQNKKIEKYYLDHEKECKYLIKNSKKLKQKFLYISHFIDVDEILTSLICSAINTVMLSNRNNNDINNNLVQVFNSISICIERSLDIFYKINKDFINNKPEVQQQLEWFFNAEYVVITPIEYFVRYPVYMQAILARSILSKDKPAKELELGQEINKFWVIMLKNEIKISQQDPEFVEFRWMLEEYRVSLFAQNLGTKYPVSNKRLNKLLQLLLSDK